MRAHKDHTEFRSPCGLWRKYIFATTRARDAHVRRRVSVDRDAFRQKQKNPFQEKVIISISRGKRGLQSGKTFSQIKTARPGPSWTGIVAPYQFSAQISSFMMQSQHVDLNWLAEIGNRCC